MRPIQVCLSISKEMHDYYQDLGLDDKIFREAAEMLGRKLLEDGILEQHLEPDINRPEFHYILILNRRDLPEPKAELKPMNIPSAGSGAMGTTPPSYKLDVKPEQPVEGLEEAERHSEILTYPMPEDGDIDKVFKVQEARIFHKIGFKAGAKWARAKMMEVLDKWEEHAIRGIRNGATAYHQGKIALITDLRDWINREG